MGDRCNIIVKVPGQTDLYLYSHYDGYRLDKIVQSGLKRGQDRWDDSQYLPRILFCELVKDDLMGTSGYGISTFEGDGGTEIVVDMGNRRISTKNGGYSFAEFIALDLDSDEEDD